MNKVMNITKVCLMVLNASFNNISVTSWRSVLLVEETRRPGENNRPVKITDKLISHNVVHLELTTSVVIGTYYIGSCKSNYHTIKAPDMTKTLPVAILSFLNL